MSINLDVLEVFINNPSCNYCVSDIMRIARVSWVTARDSIVCLHNKSWVVNNNNNRWGLNKDKVKIIKISS